MLEINFLDIGIILFLLVFMARGFMRGLVQEVAGLVGIILAFALARRFQNQMHDILSQLFGNEEWTYLLSYTVIFILVMGGMALVATGIRRLIAITFTAWLDRILGGVLGFAKGLLLATAVFYIVRRVLPGSALIENSQLAPILDAMIRYLENFLPSSFVIDPRLL